LDEKSIRLFQFNARDHSTDGDDVHLLSLHQVEDTLFERSVDIYHETVRFW